MTSSIPTPKVAIASEHVALFTSINVFVHAYMSSPSHDSSHDYRHILRVLSNAHRILQAEQEARSQDHYDSTLVYLAALLHDVGDHKYAAPGEDPETQIHDVLFQHGASKELATAVQLVAKHVSYSNEVRDPTSVAAVLSAHPELAIVQDADRLDAIGAVGAARCFAYGGAKRKNEPLDVAIEHFGEKLFRLEGMMKTDEGRRLAKERTQVLREFADHFTKETELSFEL